MPPKIEIDREKIADFCKKHHIRRLWLFGSVLCDDFREDSDIDVLYEFEPDHSPGWEIIRIEKELSEIFEGRKVDFISEKDLNRRIRNHRYFHSEPLYDER
ncbi:nucleotidyltransferase domain-containing protein [bacterium]|nr:nucleotidyltransferase domain-containing protein [FCB group bacterium]MBL7191199.1 nucleotidyltransferase domain-containing protein [bacterium]